ncbi:MAG: ABC transporter ATP-binding protein [Gammaproteobacteria bacterium]|nr:ABC transporter ATP-binding protein [Gammaproteobacteria bacterium]
MSGESLVRVENLYRYYGDFCAVNDLSFELKRGEVLGLLGANGAGKSTTMRMLSGNLAPSAGRIWIAGHDILDQPRQAKAALGYLPDQPPLYRELTVDEYLLFCARLSGVTRKACAAAVSRAKERCGLQEAGRRVIGNLSKGFQQRVGIAQAIIHEPEIVILDEPTVGLDPIQIREIRTLISELATAHSVILSTHILPEIQAVCSRVQIIHRGALVLNDTLEGLQRRMQAANLLASFHAPPAVVDLEGMPGVERVEQIAPGRFRLHVAAGMQLAEELVMLSVQRGWRLFELTAERISLEQIFVEITTRDSTAPLAHGEAA